MSEKIKLGKSMAKNKIKLFKNVVNMSADPFSKSSRITLIGDKEAIIDGCYGIIEYSDCLVKISVGNKILCFIGCDFDISDYSGTAITVSGNIKSLEFC